MSVFEDAARACVQDPAIKKAATFRGATIYGDFTDESIVIEGVRTHIISYELVDADLDQAAEPNEQITIGTTTYTIEDIIPDSVCGTSLLTLRRNT